MTGTQSFIARAALSAAAAAASLALVAVRRKLPADRRRFDRALLGAFATSRLGLFALLFLVLHLAPRGDAPGYYMQEASHALSHQLVYRDFLSSYAPLHPYLDAALIRAWHTPLAIILFTILFEIATLPFWFRVARTFLSEDKARIGALLYLASPASLQFVTVDGQNNVIIAGLIGISLYLLLRHREALAGALVGLSIALVKFLPVVLLPLYFVATPRRWRWALGAAAVLVAVYGGFLLLHAPVLQPITSQGRMKSSGDLPYLVEAVLGISIPGPLSTGLLLVVMLAILAVAARAVHAASAPTSVPDSVPVRMRILNFGTVALVLALIVFSKKSNSSYLMIALYPLCLLIDAGAVRVQKVAMTVFVFLQFIDVMEHSIWSTYLGQYRSDACHLALLRHEPVTVIFLLVQALLQGLLLWLLAKAVRELADAPRSELAPGYDELASQGLPT